MIACKDFQKHVQPNFLPLEICQKHFQGTYYCKRILSSELMWAQICRSGHKSDSSITTNILVTPEIANLLLLVKLFKLQNTQDITKVLCIFLCAQCDQLVHGVLVCLLVHYKNKLFVFFINHFKTLFLNMIALKVVGARECRRIAITSRSQLKIHIMAIHKRGIERMSFAIALIHDLFSIWAGQL